MKKVKKKLKPSWEMYSRILWDPKLRQQAFYIGFVDRMAEEGLREKLLVDWEGSDVPWNRVQYIRCGDTIVWDRNERVDLFESDQLPLEAYVVEKTSATPILIEGVRVISKPTFEWQTNQWKAISSAPNINCAQLRVATFNTLTDKYEKETIQTKLRIPAILEQINALEADIILLQEVDAPLLKELLQIAALQGWYSSDVQRTAKNYYQELVILSKYPFTFVEYQHSEQKKFLIGSWSINGQVLHIANVHLTSNRSKEALTVRTNQLKGIFTYLNSLKGEVIIAGDFNSRGTDGLELLSMEGFEDLWPTLNNIAEGYTFEPSKNPLAKHLSLTGLPARFDRVYLQSENWKATSITLFGNKAINTEGLFASDHYGLLTSLEYQAIEEQLEKTNKWSNVGATYHTGVVIIPPKEFWKSIQDIRKQHDSKYQRWMPHITLLYGFLPDRYFQEVAKELSLLAKEFEQFEIALNQYQLFSQQSSVTAWLEPTCSKAGILQDLQEALQKLFPMANNKLKKLSKFRPHMSIGQFSSELKAKELLPVWESLKFGVTQLAVISRQQDQPFELRYMVELNSGNIAEINDNRKLEQELMALVSPNLDVDIDLDERKEFALELVQETCAEILGYPIQLETLGSARLGTADINSDIDVLCSIPVSLDTTLFLENVLEQLDGFQQQARLISDAQVPILKLCIEGIDIDLLCAQNPNFPATISQLTEDDRYSFDAGSWQALSGVLEADNLLTLVKPHCSIDTFRWLVKTIKTWAATRGIKGNALGYLGSYSWTVLAAWVSQQVPVHEDKESLEVLLDYFFRLLSKQDWTTAISLTPEQDYKIHPKQDRMPILTSVQPYYNSARNITVSTAHWIQKELDNAAGIMQKIRSGKANWSMLLDKKRTPLANTIVLAIEAETPEQLLEYKGWIEGHLVGLVIALEQQCQVLVRPYPIELVDELEAEVKLGIQLAGFANDQQKLQQCLQEFIRDFDQTLQNWNPIALQWSLL
ncbi:MAG: DUF504 domain-containing protein [Aureispira sp.]|nr:DUF504 domain-containing protein [Aureispira sp.]